jgi:hypothetical protein
MDWYIVIKTIRGHRYRYRQQTWRTGKRVRTRSEYLSPETIIGYHGTFAKFERFSSDYLASANDCDSSREGFFFASNPRVAASYASTQIARRRGLEARIETIEWRVKSLAGMGIYEAEDELTKGDRFEPDTANKLKHFMAMRQRAREKLHAGEITKVTVSKRAEVKRCVLDLKNPYVHNMRGRRFDDDEFCEAAWHAQEGGHDGVIIRNTYDPGSCFSDCAYDLTNVYIVFDADKINTSAVQSGQQKSAQIAQAIPAS